MKNFLPWLAILLLGAAVRVPSLFAARPYMAYVDEGNFLHVSAHMVRDRRWIPASFLYPSLPTMAVAATARAYSPFYRLAHGNRSLREDVLTRSTGYYDTLQPFELLFLGRVLSCLASLGVILVTGLLARRVAGARGGLLAAFTAALVPALVARGGFAMVDPYAALAVVLCLLFTERMASSERPAREAVAAGAMAGFAFASKYPAILVSLSFALTVWLIFPLRERLRFWALGAAGAAGAALLAMPGLLVVPAKVFAAIRRQGELYANLTSPPLWPQVVKQAEWDVPLRGPELGWVFVTLSVAGLVAALWSSRTRPSAAGWVLYIVVTLALCLRQGFQPFRNLLPLVPIACVAFAILHDRIRQRLSRPVWSDAAAFLLIAALFAPVALRFAHARARLEDSRVEAIDWLSRHGFPGRTVLILEDFAFLPSELNRLKDLEVEVHPWEILQRRLRLRRVRFLVLTQMHTRQGKPLLGAEQLRTVLDRFEPRVRFGDETTTPFPGHWHGNRQTIHILERRREAPRLHPRGAPARGLRPPPRAGAAPRRSSSR